MDSGALNENWAAVCSHVKTYEGIDASQINAFFSQLRPQAMSEGFLMLTASTEFIKTWIERHYLETIQRALQDLYHVPFVVVVEVDPSQSAAPVPAQAPQQTMTAAMPQPSTYIGQPAQTDRQSAHPPAATELRDPRYSRGVEPREHNFSAPNPFVEPARPQQWAQPLQPSNPLSHDEGPMGGLDDGMPEGIRQERTLAESAYPSYAQFTPQSQDIAPSENGTFQPEQDRNRDAHDGEFDHYIERRERVSNTQGASQNAGKPASTLTFENFVIGDSNRMAYSMAVDVAEMPGKTPLNPLFIYGKSGLGKTHLMRAIQNYICETQPHLRTVYVDAAELLADYTDAGAAHDKEKSSYKKFKTRYEEADVLLIDDIQYLQGKKQTLDIVFQIFNKLTNQGKQIVLSADRAPKNIDIDERYQSRFNQGGTIDIQPPEIETKLGIVKSFINEYRNNEGIGHFAIPEDIQMYIAENSSSNIRELKSAVTKVIYQITFFNQHDLSVSDVRSLLENHFSGGTSRNLTVDDIQKEVENFFKVKHSDLVGPKRARNIVYPRQIAIYLCRQLLDLPFNDIGKKFNRDHSTAMHSVATVEEMMRNSREVQEEIEALTQIIREL